MGYAVTKYKISEYPDAKVGKHYSVDFKMGDAWFIRQLFWTRKEAEKSIKELNGLQKPIDNQ